MHTSNTENKGNVVIGFETDGYLMLDCDKKRKLDVKWFAREFAKFHNLGSSAVFQTSKGHYSIIFGKPLTRRKIRLLIQEAYRLCAVDKEFADIRRFGTTTIRVNKKNEKKPLPRLLYYFSNGNDSGVFQYINFWVMCRKEG